MNSELVYLIAPPSSSLLL